MKLSIAGKRKAFHDELRNHQIELLFSERRNLMVNCANLPTLSNLKELVVGVPQTLPLINRELSLFSTSSSQLLDFLMGSCQKWVQDCRLRPMSLGQWFEGVEILIKMLENCKVIGDKAKLLGVAEEVFWSKYHIQVESNKILKFDLLTMMMHFYIAALREPSLLPFPHQQWGVLELVSLPWRSKTSEFLKFICFLNFLLQKAIQYKADELIYRAFISESIMVIKLQKVLQQIYDCQLLESYECLVVPILRLLINLTFAVKDQKLIKALTLTSFSEFMLSRINSVDELFAKEYFLQLTCNIIVDSPTFRQYIRHNLDTYAVTQLPECWASLVEEIQTLSQSRDY